MYRNVAGAPRSSRLPARLFTICQKSIFRASPADSVQRLGVIRQLDLTLLNFRLFYQKANLDSGD
jgi:hypothetical protein